MPIPAQPFKTAKKVVEDLVSKQLVENKGQRQVHFVAGNDEMAQTTTVYYGCALDGTHYVIYWFPAD